MAMSDDTTCPTCGRDDFASPLGMRNHHARTHGESLTDTVTCEYCGDEFEVPTYRDSIYCSEQCAAADRRQRITKTCEGCGDEFEVVPRNDDQRYCSPKCGSRYANRNRETSQCAQCNRTFRHPKSDDPIYCCDACYRENEASRPRPDHPAILCWLLYVYESHTIQETHRRQRAHYGHDDALHKDHVRAILDQLGVKQSSGASELKQHLLEADPEDVLGPMPDPRDDTYKEYREVTD